MNSPFRTRITTSVRVHIYLVGNRSRTPRAHVRCLIDKTQVDHCIKPQNEEFDLIDVCFSSPSFNVDLITVVS